MIRFAIALLIFPILLLEDREHLPLTDVDQKHWEYYREKIIIHMLLSNNEVVNSQSEFISAWDKPLVAYFKDRNAHIDENE